MMTKSLRLAVYYWQYLCWFVRMPTHWVGHNAGHAHKIDRETWRLMDDRWMAERPRRPE